MQSMTSKCAPSADASIARYEAYLRADPENATLRVALADLYHRAARFDDALAALQPCLDDEPGHAVARGRVAAVLISQHRFVEAEQHLRELASGDDASAPLLHNLGLALYYQSRWSEALDAFSKARALGLDSREAQASNLRYLTMTLHHLGDTAAALEAGLQWAELNADGAGGYVALLEMDHGEMAAAHRRAAAVLARDPGNIDAAVVEGMWDTERQDIDSAAAHFERVVRAEPDNARGWLGLGLIHLHEERNDAALQALRNATRLMPRHAATLTTLAWAHFIARELSAAEQTFREAIALDRGFAEAHGGLALTLVYLKRYTEARRETRIALRLNPATFGAVYAQGALMALDGKRAQGEAGIAQALQRPVMADGRSLIDHLQVYLRRQIARGRIGKDEHSPPR
jgi:tetratricopeptide (TPR) repeat protein